MPYLTVEELVKRNKEFAGPDHVPQPLLTERKADPPHTMVIACFDPRSSPEDIFKASERDHEIVCIRNAGGHPQHNIHDIVELDNLLTIHEIIVVHHQDCGKIYLTQDGVHKHLAGYVSEEDKKKFDYETFDFNLFTKDEIASTVKEDVQFLRDHPWIRPEMKISGFYLDIKTGLLEEV